MIALFGNFELDTFGFRLKREGKDLHLAKQPLDLLIFLVDRRGEIVTREDICSALWGNPNVEGSEHSINTTIRKIRAALGDDPSSPKYIETVVRRGYRFIGPVVIPKPEEPQPTPAPQTRRLRFGWTIAAAVVVFFAIAALAERNRLQSTPPQLAWRPLTKTVHLKTPLASDGSNVYWTEAEKLGCRPWQVSVSGGDPIPVRSPFPRGLVADAAPSGQLLVVVPDNCRFDDFRDIQGPLWELNPSSGQTLRVGNVIAQAAAFSSDGQRIAFAQWNRLWLARRDGSQTRQLATLPGDIANIRWSPNGKLLRFTLVLYADWTYPLWEAETETGNTRPFLSEATNGADLSGGAWMRDGTFVFSCPRPAHSDLWRLAPAAWPSLGRHPSRLTSGPLDFLSPTALPGRSDLAVVGSHQQGELDRYDSASQRWVPFLNGISAEMVDFSRDGQWAVYVTYPERDLWRSRADGSDAIQLTRGPLRAGLPRFSPDGATIAFTGDYSGKDLRTWLIPSAGGEAKTATQLAPGTAEVGPKWSPDGTKLLMRLDRPSGQPPVFQIVDLASGKTELVPGSERKMNQRWSPDGKWLAATPYNSPGLDVYNFERRQWSTAAAMTADYPNWSRKGDYIYFSATLETGEVAIYRVAPERGRPERIASLADTLRAGDDLYNQWVGIAPDDSPVILKSADLQQIYLLSMNK